MSTEQIPPLPSSADIAIIGMAGRFPGAPNLDIFWNNLRDGVESITFFSDAELLAAGVEAVSLQDPNYVRAGGVLADADMFDAPFFGISGREAEIMDPQHRIFLECAWEALENAGYHPDARAGLTGVFAGTGANSHLMNLLANPAIVQATDGLQLIIGNDKDYLSTRVSYKLNLRGPSVTIQTACSTSLVAVHMACQSLLTYQSDMALAGGVSISLNHKRGYRYQEGGIASRDGHCRAFAAQASGTVGGSGVGIVVLKRLAEAITDGDRIRAVIRGSAINNDGSLKVGYTAPSQTAQADVIASAHALANVDPATITYVEAHGTGTFLGDPVEVAALTQAFREQTSANQFCALGSVKTNIGHLDAAAGVASLIKTVLALENKQIPPSLHCQTPNSTIDWANSPFYVNTTLRKWTAHGHARRAGVSSFGIGGTNAHVVLEEAPIVSTTRSSRPHELLLLSGKTQTALTKLADNLAQHLRRHPELRLADVTHTLQVGRKAFELRQAMICSDLRDAADVLAARDVARVLTGSSGSIAPQVTFMFSGQGSQYVHMAAGLYETEPTFRAHVDQCSDLLRPDLHVDLRDVLYPPQEKNEEATAQLNQTIITQPALFTVEYALAQLLMSWGVHPSAMLGHSIGEYVAACLAGVFTLVDALRVVAARSRLMQQQPAGAMLSVALAESEVRRYIDESLAIGAVNAPSLCVVSGPIPAVNNLERRLIELGVSTVRLHTSHAFHSSMMEPVLDTFFATLQETYLHPPRVPFISNVSGTWITQEEATNPAYWVSHLRQPVRFADGVKTATQDGGRGLIEVGPGQQLTMLAQATSSNRPDLIILPSLPDAKRREPDVSVLLTTLGKLWVAGVDIDWGARTANEHRQRVPLPTYPFEHQVYWVEPEAPQASRLSSRSSAKKTDMSHWFYVPAWRRSLLPTFEPLDVAVARSSYLVFLDELGLGDELVTELIRAGSSVVTVKRGESFANVGPNVYSINPGESRDYDSLLQHMHSFGKRFDSIIHLWGVTPLHTTGGSEPGGSDGQLGFSSLIFLAQAMGRQSLTHVIMMHVISNGLHDVTGSEPLCPEKATILGACKVIPQEYPNVRCRNVDVEMPAPGDAFRSNLSRTLRDELVAGIADPIVAYRARHRWVQEYEAVRLAETRSPTRLREGGVYLITGGLGEIGLAIGHYLAQRVGARLALIGRSSLPARTDWAAWLATHPEDDRTSRRIKAIQTLEAAGSDVLVLQADVSDVTAMSTVISNIRERWGSLHGIFHAAGPAATSAALPIHDLTPADWEAQFRAKTQGTRVLEDIADDMECDFCILMSSLSTILGGIGFAAYSAANCYLDTTAACRSRTGKTAWTSIAWDGWQFTPNKLSHSGPVATVASLALTVQEGIQVLDRILSFQPTVQIIVSTGELSERIAQWVKLETVHQEATPAVPSSLSLRPRPVLHAPYVVPTSELEQTLVDIWQHVLGVGPIGIEDNFFELGGHSLLAIQLAARLRAEFNVNLTLRRMLESPTIANLSVVLEELILEEVEKTLE